MLNGEPIGGPVVGTVTEALPDTHFMVDLGSAGTVHTYLSGRMRLHHIRVLVGDRVEVLLDQYGKRGRITKRL